MIAKTYIFGRKPKANLLLDNFPADFAFSFDKISTSYSGPCLRVIEDTNNTSKDIGFLGGVLDVADLLAFVGSGNGFINRGYSQTPSGNFFFNGTPATTPKIVNAGSLITLNGKPSMYFDGVDDKMFLAIDEVVTNDFSIFTYGKRDAAGNLYAPFTNPAPDASIMQYIDNNFYFIGPNGYDTSTTPDTSAAAMLLEGHSLSTGPGAGRDIYKNQVPVATSSTGGSFPGHFNRLGVYGGQFMKGHVSEIILYKTNQSANRLAIGNDIILRKS